MSCCQCFAGRQAAFGGKFTLNGNFTVYLLITFKIGQCLKMFYNHVFNLGKKNRYMFFSLNYEFITGCQSVLKKNPCLNFFSQSSRNLSPKSACVVCKSTQHRKYRVHIFRSYAIHWFPYTLLLCSLSSACPSPCS